MNKRQLCKMALNRLNDDPANHSLVMLVLDYLEATDKLIYEQNQEIKQLIFREPIKANELLIEIINELDLSSYESI